MSKPLPCPWLVILLLIGCTDPSPLGSSLGQTPVEVRSTRKPDPEQVLKDVNAIVNGMLRAHGDYTYTRR